MLAREITELGRIHAGEVSLEPEWFSLGEVTYNVLDWGRYLAAVMNNIEDQLVGNLIFGSSLGRSTCMSRSTCNRTAGCMSC
jgi:hypothetical protein